MTSEPRVLIVDDDPYASMLLHYNLNQRFEDLWVEMRSLPNVDGQYDVLVLDNEVGGVQCAASLARRVREQNPGALIVVLSATLDTLTVKLLQAINCSVICIKGDRSDEEMLYQTIGDFLELRTALQTTTQVSSLMLMDVVERLTHTLRSWDERLERMHAREDVPALGCEHLDSVCDKKLQPRRGTPSLLPSP